MKTITSSKKFAPMDVVFPAMFAALIAVCSWISLPIGPVPFTLQTFAVCLCAGLLGTQLAMYSVLVYIVLGAIGVPVFAGFSSGLTGSASGYIIGFLFTALIVGLITEKFGRSFVVLTLSMVLGIAVCYVFGTVWFIAVYTRTTGPVGIMAALGWCVFPFILPDLAKIVLASVLVNRLSKVVQIIR